MTVQDDKDLLSKAEIIDIISNDYNISKNEAAVRFSSVVDTLFKVLTQERKGVRIKDFMTFRVAYRNARMGKNPRTGEAIDIPESYNVVIKNSKKLKDSLNS